MNKLGASKFVEFGSVGLALLSIVMVVTVSSAPAKERKAKRSGTGSQVVTHISFNGLSAVDVATQQQVDEKPYLYVQRGREEGISFVDITKSRFLSVQLSRALAGRGREWRPATSPIAMSFGKPLSAMIRIFGGRMINRIKTSWLAEFISIAFLFLTTLLVVTVSDIGKERKAKKARTGSPESHNGAEQ